MVCTVLSLAGASFAQSDNCSFKPPFYHLHFGRGNVRDINATSLALYERVSFSCPGDGYYSFASSTGGCFGGDWHILSEDHTPGDKDGNMLLVNSAYNSGTFFTTRVKGFKNKARYQFGVWLMNVCKPTRKCPFPLLPNLTIRLQTPAGRTIAQFTTGDLPRREAPHWTQHRAEFVVPTAETELVLTMINNAPGGCGNDFALDDITFRECVKPSPAKVVVAKKATPIAVKKQQPVAKKQAKKEVPLSTPVKKESRLATVINNQKAIPVNDKPLLIAKKIDVVPVPDILKQRANPLIKRIETEAGEIQIDLYDNGEIDGDTVSIYHNNRLLIARQELSKKPISFRIRIDKNQPHHEFVMVANNLGSIPPNTSLMIVTAKDRRYQVFISSTEQQNASVIVDLKE